MEVRSMEAMAVGLLESLDMEYINQGPGFIPNLAHDKYPAAAVATALYIASGIRGTERYASTRVHAFTGKILRRQNQMAL